MERGSTDPRILNLGTRWRLVVPTPHEAGWAPEAVLRRWRREKIPAPARNL